MGKVRSLLLLAGALLAPSALSGCGVSLFSMGIFTPIPVQPWVAERMDEMYCHPQDFQTPILPPIPPGYKPLCEDPPDQAAILRAMPHVTRGIPYIYEEFRDNVEFAIERLVDHIDPPRFFPLVGPAQLHHCHWKVTIFYDETIESSYPFPVQCKKHRQQIMYIDKDHLHQYACTPEQQMSLSRDLSGF
jgi:hypothetical protein